MDEEALIRLELEQQHDCVLVSSPQFPLLHLAISSASDAEIEKSVLPVLQKMVEHQIGAPVILRLVDAFRVGDMPAQEIIPPHVIASRAAAGGGRVRA